MAASAISPDQFARLCKRCTCLQLISTTPDDILPKNPPAGELGGEQEVDLPWNVTNLGTFVLSQGADRCDCCKFLQSVVLWRNFRNGPVAGAVPMSLHYVFRQDETVGYGLRALRIRSRLAGGEPFLINCPIAAATDLDMGTSLGLQPPLSHIDEESILWMKSKLESCVSHNHLNPDKTFIPDRLIDVRGNQLSLVLTKDFQPRDAGSHRYIALTYCWGPEPHASKQLKTTRDNISQYLRQIPESSLPQVIKDAVAVTRALSIPFLWVDALCILQDDVSDWEHQCDVMEQIYGNAYTAVAAVSSQNCEEGFIKRKDRLLFPFRNESGDTRVFGIYPPPNQADTQQEVPQSPWIKRGWTFQERIAATRILMFSKGSLHFDCKDFSNTQGRDEKVDRDYYYIMLDRETIDSGETAAIYQQWSKLMAQIKPKAHQLTRKTDFLPSIGGIASLFSKKLDDDYAAGLWKESMHQSLYWALSTTGKPSLQDLLKALKTPSPYIAPSWSWASRNEPFRFIPSRSFS
ncbi:hypothetical protein H9Q72_010438 [Fusarium xylarioides]|uniref:Heterokaryon incompatibility domain-containing protein n=1 Tax=Fusarium xylarioides TaxID=221167 RepID=A0A9P7HIR0_9HYPO|nr:hypothetical protein H9Q72_010438 [Fusarium xylarioides]